MTDFLTDYYAEQRMKEGAFRCDRCYARLPLSLMVEQDGLRICSVRCFDRPGLIEKDQMAVEAAQLAAARGITPLEYPVTPALQGALVISDISANPVVVARSGTVSFTLYGLNFSASDTRTYEGGITENSDTPNAALTENEISITASSQAGDFFFYYNGAKQPYVIQVR